MLKITNKRDVLAGLLFIAVGASALWIGKDLRMGTPVRMGAGFFPTILAGLMILLGLVTAASALRSADEATPRMMWRPLVVVAGSVALFAFLIDGAGLALTCLIMVVLSRLARPGHPWGETLLLALGTSIAAAAVFYYGLGLRFPLWPQLG